METTLLKNARVVAPWGVIEKGWVEFRGDTIQEIGAGERVGGLDLNGHLLTPGLVDLHVHGGAGFSFQDATSETGRRVTQFHMQHGTTTMLAGLGARPIDELVTATQAMAPLVEDGTLAGVFLEGPFVSQKRRGAQDPSAIRKPDLQEMQELLAASPGTVRMVTLAPELPDALELVDAIQAAGAVAAVGHTDASYEEANSAFAAGASVATHLFNGMRPIHHRDPGPVIAALNDPRVICEVVADGYHLHDATLKFVFSAIGASRVALITDAIEAAGVGDGRYAHGVHGERVVIVENGMAMLEDRSSIAGSTLTMDKALRRAVHYAKIPLLDAVQAATSTPARAIGLEGTVGVLQPGAQADLVVFDPSLSVRRVLKRGRWVSPA